MLIKEKKKNHVQDKLLISLDNLKQFKFYSFRQRIIIIIEGGVRAFPYKKTVLLVRK